MGQQDLYESDFYDDNSRFAVIFNGGLFRGKEIMMPEELETEDSVMVSIKEKRNGKKIICNKIRKWRGKYVAIMVLENQTYVDYRMVLRVMESEIIGYENQRKERYNLKHKNDIKYMRNEYLSRMKKGQKFIPIITGEITVLKTVVRNLMKNQKISFEEAVEILEISKSKQKKLISLI